MINELNPKKEAIVFGNDSIAIVKYIAGLPGGRTLDLADYPENVVYAGHVIKYNADGVYSPLTITEGAYADLAEGEAFAGVLYRSIDKEHPAAAIMTVGVVNGKIIPAPLPEGFLPGISVVEDIEA